MSDPGSHPPGWYEQPAGSATLRWWDGKMWTDHRRPKPADPNERLAPPTLAPSPTVTEAAAVSAPPTARELAEHLSAEASRFTAWAGLFVLLMALGSLGVGWAAAQQRVCDITFGGSLSCESTTDGATLAVVGLSTFVAGLLFVLPLRGIASLLRGTAALLARAADEARD